MDKRNRPLPKRTLSLRCAFSATSAWSSLLGERRTAEYEDARIPLLLTRAARRSSPVRAFSQHIASRLGGRMVRRAAEYQHLPASPASAIGSALACHFLLYRRDTVERTTPKLRCTSR